jgi:hypothetical protein
MMRRLSSNNSSSVEARDRASVEAWDSEAGAGEWSLTTSSLGFSAGEDGVDAAGCPAELVFQHGVGARAGLAYAVLNVGERAHSELQAAGEVGAVAVAQRYAPAHDVVAEPFQAMSIHEAIMTHHGRRYRTAARNFFYLLHQRVETIAEKLPRDQP